MSNKKHKPDVFYDNEPNWSVVGKSITSIWLIVVCRFLTWFWIGDVLRAISAIEDAGEGNGNCIKYGADENGKVIVGVDTQRQKDIIQQETGNRVCPTVICRFCWKFPCYTTKWYNDMVEIGEEAEAHGTAAFSPCKTRKLCNRLEFNQNSGRRRKLSKSFLYRWQPLIHDEKHQSLSSTSTQTSTSHIYLHNGWWKPHWGVMRCRR